MPARRPAGPDTTIAARALHVPDDRPIRLTDNERVRTESVPAERCYDQCIEPFRLAMALTNHGNGEAMDGRLPRLLGLGLGRGVRAADFDADARRVAARRRSARS